MSQQNSNANDPLEMMRKMWGNMGFNLPGMVVPTFDSDELEKRISDLKAVEGWLRMNLSMLQMTIRSLEMQNTTLSAVRAMGEMASAVDPSGTSKLDAPPPGQEGALWPWGLMQQIQEYMQRQTEAAKETAASTGDAETGKPSREK